MTGKSDLFVSAALHRAVIDVNEQGTEAAASTEFAMEIDGCCEMEESRTFTVRCDHPFMFVLRARSTAATQTQMGESTILFTGRYGKPPA